MLSPGCYDTCGGNPFAPWNASGTLLDQPHVSLSRQPIPLLSSLNGLVRDRARADAGCPPSGMASGLLLLRLRERPIRVSWDYRES